MNERAVFFFRNFETILLSTLSIAWGLWIGFPLSPLYIVAVQSIDVGIIPLFLVGAVFMLSGGLKFYGISKPETKWLERGGMIGAVAWLWIFFLQLTLGFVSPGTILYPFLSIWNGWLYLKARLYIYPEDLR